MSGIADRGFIHLGMDVSKESIAVAVLSPDRDVAEVDKVGDACFDPVSSGVLGRRTTKTEGNALIAGSNKGSSEYR